MWYNMGIVKSLKSIHKITNNTLKGIKKLFPKNENNKGINYQFRLDSYWVDKGIRQSILRDVKVPNDGPQIPNTSTNQMR